MLPTRNIWSERAGFAANSWAWQLPHDLQWLHRLRRAMVRPDRERLMGPVEVDETYIGGERSGKRGRGADDKILVAVAVEDVSVLNGKTKGISRIRLSRIPNASADTLRSFHAENVESGSQVRTDGWLGYEPITVDGFDHVVIESKKLVITHLTISLLKSWLLGIYQGAVQAQQLNITLMNLHFVSTAEHPPPALSCSIDWFISLLQQTTFQHVEIVGGSSRKPGAVKTEIWPTLNILWFVESSAKILYLLHLVRQRLAYSTMLMDNYKIGYENGL